MKYYYVNKETGYLVKESELFDDAVDCGYDDITDPWSFDYCDFDRHYSITNYHVEE